MDRYFWHHYNGNACVVHHSSEMTRPQVVFCAHSSFLNIFMLLLNSTSVQFCISTNLFQWSVNNGNCSVLSHKVSILIYAYCLDFLTDFVMQAGKFSASSTDNSDITKCQRNKYEKYHVLCERPAIHLSRKRSWNVKNEKCIAGYFASLFSHFTAFHTMVGVCAKSQKPATHLSQTVAKN